MTYILNNPDVIIRLTGQHLYMTLTALVISLAIALPLSLLLLRSERLANGVLGLLGVLYTIPSIALLILLLPVFGLNQRSVVVALIIYTQVILVRNMVVGMKEVPAYILEAAKGVGMSTWQRWRRVQLPLAMPVIIAGLRIATIVAIGIATIGAKFGAGGLGTLLFDGIAQNRYDKIVAGSLVVVLVAILLNRLLITTERYYQKPV
ncbi:MAG: glycine betaine/carnitine/choline transport system permease protein OpuCB [Chloroflexota bacterium]|nr:ABC transporter permease [Ardenticatenaceae bacterium]GIK59039.1 MAG: glycine betaine/carnitine/choline transport system permease protein OpuCB [Chloroflexota bacterium]